MNVLKKQKELGPLYFKMFHRPITEQYDYEIDKSLQKIQNYLDSEEKEVEILNNAFSEFKTHFLRNNRSKLKKQNTRRFQLINSHFKNHISKISHTETNYFKNPILAQLNNAKYYNKDKDDNSNNNKNSINIRTSINNKKNKTLYGNTFNSFKNNITLKKLSKMNNKNIRDFLNENNNNNNYTLTKTIIKDNPHKFNTNSSNFNSKTLLKLSDSRGKEADLRLVNLANRTGGLLKSSKRNNRLLNFMEYYNISKNSKERENQSKTININNNSKSYKSINNLYQSNPNKLVCDLFHIKNINSKFKDKIERSTIKLEIKNKKFNKKYKRSEIKFFGNEDTKVIKNLRRMGKKKKFDSFAELLKKMVKPKIPYGSNYRRKKTVSEELEERKMREKKFYDTTDNMILNNQLVVYDINVIDRRLRREKENYNKYNII
jgi:hypothetical protein